MDTSLLSLLEASLDHTSPYFAPAQRQLEQAKETNFPEFIQALSDVIVNPQASSNTRHLAGIMIKNAFCVGKANEQQQAQVLARMTRENIDYIKAKMLDVMKTGNVNEAVLAACSVVSRIAEIELQKGTWPDFFDIILGMISSQGILACRSCFTCLNFLIEDLANIYEQTGNTVLTRQQCDGTLTALVKGIYMDDIPSRRMALRCLLNLLIFISPNMQNESERRVIIEAICRNCDQGVDPQARTAAYDCLVQLVTEYYEVIASSLPIIVPFLWLGIDSGEAAFAIPSFEFWNTICETELEYGEVPENQNIIPQVIPYLLPKILHTMTLHEFEDVDTDSWTLPMAAGLCLSLCCKVVKNDLVPLVLDFIKQNFTSTQWNRREAAVLAYGYIMEGPDTETLKLLVHDSFGNLCDVLADPSVAVQDTAAWTIGRIASLHTDAIVNLLGSLKDETSNISKITRALFLPPRVAINVCWIFHELAEGLACLENGVEVLDSWFLPLCDALVRRSRSADAQQRNLYISAYSSLCSLIANVSMQQQPQMLELLSHFVRMLAEMVANDLCSNEARAQQDILCGVIQILLTRLDVSPHTQSLWNSIYQILSVENSEDAMLALSALLNTSEGARELQQHLGKLVEIVIRGLQHPEAAATCKIATELVCDVARTMEHLLIPHVNPILELLLANLADANGPKKLKPPIVTAIGDVAMAIGGHFGVYTDRTLALLLQAAATNFEMGPTDSPEWINYINDLREGVLSAFTGIVYGLKEGNRLDALRRYVSSILGHVEQILATPQEYFSVTNYKLAVALVGDLANAFGKDLSTHLVDSVLVKNINRTLATLEQNQDPDFRECQAKVLWLLQLLQASAGAPN